MLLERPAWRTDLSLTSGNHDFRRAPTIPQQVRVACGIVYADNKIYTKHLFPSRNQEFVIVSVRQNVPYDQAPIKSPGNWVSNELS
jgi:hypothetical protein